MRRSFQKPSPAASVSNVNAKCQKCLQTGHWTADCSNERVYKARPSRTALLLNPKLKLPEATMEKNDFIDPRAVKKEAEPEFEPQEFDADRFADEIVSEARKKLEARQDRSERDRYGDRIDRERREDHDRDTRKHREVQSVLRNEPEERESRREDKPRNEARSSRSKSPTRSSRKSRSKSPARSPPKELSPELDYNFSSEAKPEKFNYGSDSDFDSETEN